MRASLFEPFTAIDLPLGDRRDGKVRASWACGDDQRLIVTTDRLSAFDRVLAGVPYKGQVLNELSDTRFHRLPIGEGVTASVRVLATRTASSPSTRFMSP